MSMNRALVEFEQRTLTEMRKLERTVLSRMELLHTQLNSKLYFIESKLDALTDAMHQQQQQQQFLQRRPPFLKRDPNHHRFSHHSSGSNLNSTNPPGSSNSSVIMHGAVPNRIGRRIYCGSGSGELRPTASNSYYYASNNSGAVDDAAIEYGGTGGGGRRSSEMMQQQDNGGAGGGGNMLIRSFESCVPMNNNNNITPTTIPTPTTTRPFNGNGNNGTPYGMQQNGIGPLTAQFGSARHSISNSSNNNNNNMYNNRNFGNPEYGINNSNSRISNGSSSNNSNGINSNESNIGIGIGITPSSGSNNLNMAHGIQAVQQHQQLQQQQQQNIVQFVRKHSSSSLAEQKVVLGSDHLDLAFHHGSTMSLYAGTGIRNPAMLPLSGTKVPFASAARAKQRKQQMVNSYFGGVGSALNKLAAANNWTINGVKMMGSSTEEVSPSLSSAVAAVVDNTLLSPPPPPHHHVGAVNFCPNPSQPLRQTRGTCSQRKVRENPQWTARSVVGIYTDEEDEEGDDLDEDDEEDENGDEDDEDGDMSTEGPQTDAEQYKETTIGHLKHHNDETANNLLAGGCDQLNNFLAPSTKCQQNLNANVSSLSASTQNGTETVATNKPKQQQQQKQHKQGGAELRANSAENGTRKNLSVDHHHHKTAADARNHHQITPIRKWSTARPKRTYGSNGNSLCSTDYGTGTAHSNGHANAKDGQMAQQPKIDDGTKMAGEEDSNKNEKNSDEQKGGQSVPLAQEMLVANVGENDGANAGGDETTSANNADNASAEVDTTDIGRATDSTADRIRRLSF